MENLGQKVVLACAESNNSNQHQTKSACANLMSTDITSKGSSEPNQATSSANYDNKDVSEKHPPTSLCPKAELEDDCKYIVTGLIISY